MNNKLLAVRVSSLQHYKQEVRKLEEALRVTSETITDLQKSFSEFIDFVEGDVFLIHDDKVVSFVGFDDFYGLKGDIPIVSLKVKRLDQYGRLSNIGTEYYYFDNPWTLIKKAKIKEVENEA